MSRREWSTQTWRAEWEQRPGDAIDLRLDRVQGALSALSLTPPVVITVAGTNGKGSVCAMLDAILRQAGYKVGLYLSPPLDRLHETIRLNGEPVDEDTLRNALWRADQAQPGMTWFELCTVAAWIAFGDAPLDAWVLEVGMGGRNDAVNALAPDCAVITSVDIDHSAYLGPDREAIGLEKAHIMRAGRPAVVCDPVPPASVLAYAQEIGADIRRLGLDFNYGGDRQQWQWSGRSKRFSGLAYPALRGVNQLLNAAGALAVLEALYQRLPISAQAVRTGLALVELPGRFQVLPGQPALVLDVAHNPHAVAALAQNLDQMGFFPRTHAVFGAMADKDLAAIFQKMAPLVDSWHFTNLEIPRAATAEALAKQFDYLRTGGQFKTPPGTTVFQHADPQAALAAAVAATDPADRILVFGSFHTVGGVMKNGLPRMPAPKAH